MRLFSALMCIVVVGVLIGCSRSLSGTRTDKNNSEGNKIAVLKGTIKRQEEKINQLQYKISEQQVKKEQPKTEQAAQDTGKNPVAEALRKRWNCCPNTDIKISGEVVRVYLVNVKAMVGFLSGNPKSHARIDLNIFLEETGFKTGTIEYYSSPPSPAKMFSISGSLSNAKTRFYHSSVEKK